MTVCVVTEYLIILFKRLTVERTNLDKTICFAPNPLNTELIKRASRFSLREDTILLAL